MLISIYMSEQKEHLEWNHAVLVTCTLQRRKFRGVGNKSENTWEKQICSYAFCTSFLQFSLPWVFPYDFPFPDCTIYMEVVLLQFPGVVLTTLKSCWQLSATYNQIHIFRMVSSSLKSEETQRRNINTESKEWFHWSAASLASLPHF